MYTTHGLMVIDPCANYAMPMSNQTEIMGWTQSYVLQEAHEPHPSPEKTVPIIKHFCTKL